MCRFFPLILAALLTACPKEATDSWQGYIEGEFVLLASPYAGQLQKLYVRRGDRVEAAKPVFALEQESERAARVEAEEKLKMAQARFENLRVPRRPPEIEALREQVRQPEWAQWIGSLLPLTHFLVLVRGIMLKGNVLQDLWPQIWPIVAFMLAVIAIGLGFYRRTLD